MVTFARNLEEAGAAIVILAMADLPAAVEALASRQKA